MEMLAKIPLIQQIVSMRLIWLQPCQVLRNNKDITPQFVGVLGKVYSDLIVNEVRL